METINWGELIPLIVGGIVALIGAFAGSQRLLNKRASKADDMEAKEDSALTMLAAALTKQTEAVLGQTAASKALADELAQQTLTMQALLASNERQENILASSLDQRTTEHGNIVDRITALPQAVSDFVLDGLRGELQVAVSSVDVMKATLTELQQQVAAQGSTSETTTATLQEISNSMTQVKDLLDAIKAHCDKQPLPST